MDLENISHIAKLPVAFSSLLEGLQSPVKHLQKLSVAKDFRRHLGFNSDAEAFDLKRKAEIQNEKKAVSEAFLRITVLKELPEIFRSLDRNAKDVCSNPSFKPHPLENLKIMAGILRRKRSDVGDFLSRLNFARVGELPSNFAVFTVPREDEIQHHHLDEPKANAVQNLAPGLLGIPFTVSLAEFIKHLPQLKRSSVEHPDKESLISVQDFFMYTESEGRKFFEELDRDGDGQVTLEDLEIAMKEKRLPRRYARDFLRQTRSHIFSKSIEWKQFLSLVEQKEGAILRAFTTLCLTKSGTLQKSQILTTLKSAGLPASEESATAMMRYFNADAHGSISYGNFRNFMLLLPFDRLRDDPRNLWFEAATVVSVASPTAIPAESLLKSALAGGIASALSTSLLYPLDTMKTRVQSSSLSFPELVSRLPQIGARGLYRGSVPAVLGQFSSHGLRTGIFEAIKLILINFAPSLPEIQVQSVASFWSTALGTAVRIPCEVMKQRLQAGQYDNAGEAVLGILHRDGLGGFFRGTTPTLCREVPFYVAGITVYAQAKKAAQKSLKRELEPWETIALGALSGGIAAVGTTPFDVMKTKMMTAPAGLPLSIGAVAAAVLRHEGPLGLFKGAVPRFFWTAPVGAMNFAGYELAKKAMDADQQRRN